MNLRRGMNGAGPIQIKGVRDVLGGQKESRENRGKMSQMLTERADTLDENARHERSSMKTE